MRAHMQRSRWTPWIGLFAPPIAWAIHHQVGSDLVSYDCRIGETPLIALVGGVMALIALASGLISWISRRDGPRAEIRTFAAYLGAMSGAVFFLALVFQTMATLMLPACQR
jgi:hypothetical protein